MSAFMFEGVQILKTKGLTSKSCPWWCMVKETVLFVHWN